MSTRKKNQNEKSLVFYQALAKEKSLQIEKSKKEPKKEEREVKETFYGG